MEKQQIIEAGERARVLARRVADLIVSSSDVPPAHWEEVLERVAQILATHAAKDLATSEPCTKVDMLPIYAVLQPS